MLFKGKFCNFCIINIRLAKKPWYTYIVLAGHDTDDIELFKIATEATGQHIEVLTVEDSVELIEFLAKEPLPMLLCIDLYKGIILNHFLKWE
ncbi:MAG: hypothetical protein M3040_03245 [Bacteroidota bacterium]|nr:hypothetical protein [Bacteroidota bacterium]